MVPPVKKRSLFDNTTFPEFEFFTLVPFGAAMSMP